MKLQGIVTDKLVGIYHSGFIRNGKKYENSETTVIEHVVGFQLIQTHNLTHSVHSEITRFFTGDVSRWWIEGLAGKAWTTILGK